MSQGRDFVSEFKADMYQFIAENPPLVLPPLPLDVLPLLTYIDHLDSVGALTSAVSDKLRSLIKEIPK
ncbi:MAG: hypothetical protein JWO11_3568 [Nocardioides sp.]|nr:hypothetical protein [Nocardioides sp.]